MRKITLRMQACAIAALVGLAAGPAAAEKMELKFQSSWGANLPASGTVAKHISQSIEQASGGDLVFRYYDPGKLVPPLQVHDAVAAGTVEAGFTTPVYLTGQIPAAALFGGSPFGLDAMTFVGWLRYGGGRDLWREMYAKRGLVSVPCGLMEPEAGGWYTKEIKTVEDFKGLKVRFAGIGGEVLKKLGASVSLLGGGDIFPALERKMIDGTEFSMPAIDKMIGFQRVAKFYYLPGWHQPATANELIINKAVWDKMTPAQQKIVELTCSDAMIMGGTETQLDNAKALQFFKENGVEVRSFPPEVIEALRKTTEEVYAEMSAKDAEFKRVLDSIRAYQASAGSWTAINR